MILILILNNNLKKIEKQLNIYNILILMIMLTNILSSTNSIIKDYVKILINELCIILNYDNLRNLYIKNASKKRHKISFSNEVDVYNYDEESVNINKQQIKINTYTPRVNKNTYTPRVNKNKKQKILPPIFVQPNFSDELDFMQSNSSEDFQYYNNDPLIVTQNTEKEKILISECNDDYGFFIYFE
jgi:hypothetical protein